MWKRFLTLAALILSASYITAQTTAISATVVDSDSQAWNKGSWKIVFQPNQIVDPNPADYNINGTPLSPSVTNQSGSLDSSAGLSLSVYQSTAISPAGSSWNLTICPLSITACGTLNFQAIGSSLNLSSAITQAIVAPRFRAVANTYGYSDTEAQIQLNPGSNYFNVTSLNQRCYNGSAWNNCYNGGITAIPVPISEGGTNAITAAQALINLGTEQIAQGGTGATTAPVAESKLLSNPASGMYIIECTSSTLCIPLEEPIYFITPPTSGSSTTLLQDALDDSSIKDIYLGAGTYTTDRLSLNHSNVTIRGAGKGITTLQAACPYTLSPQYGSSGGLLYIWPLSGSLSNVHLKDITLSGCSSSSPITSISLDGTDATITATNSLSIGSYVVMNLITGGATPSLNGGGPFEVISSGLSSSQFKVAYTGASGGPYAQSTAYFTTTDSNGVGDSTKQGVIIDGCNYCSIEDTAVINMGGESVLFAPTIVGDYPIVENVDITGGATDSLSSNFSYGARFLNNTIKNTFSGNCLGFSGDATVVQGNVISGCTGGGIFAGGSGYVHNTLGYDAEISGNIFDNDHVCIELSDDEAVSTVTKLYDIANNTCSNYGAYGLFTTLTQAGDIIFITDFNTTAINYGGSFSTFLASGDGTYFISNSHLIGTGGSIGQQYGIYVLAGSPVLNINNNIIINNQLGDIDIAMGATPTVNYGINTLTNGINISSQIGPATAPSGSCSPNGTWVFSQDRHATYCSAGTWSTVI